MPNTINGWTSAGLLPSYAVTSHILSGSGSAPPVAPLTPTAPAPTTQAAGPTMRNGSPMPKVPLPSTPAVGGFGQTGAPGGLPPGGDPRGGMPPMTPEQAYSQYLRGAMGAQNSTPLTNFLNLTGPGTPMSGGIYGSASPWGNNTNQPGTGFGFGGGPSQASILQQIAGLPLSPYAMSYGTPAAQAPAPTPQWGYPSGYGVPSPGWVNPQSAGGFGFSGGGFGF